MSCDLQKNSASHKSDGKLPDSSSGEGRTNSKKQFQWKEKKDCHFVNYSLSSICLNQ